MQHIWKRFINVIFVREYEQHFRRNNQSANATTSFELSTVPFPYPIKRVIVTKNLDFWRNGKYRHSTKLNIDKTGDLAGSTKQSFGLYNEKTLIQFDSKCRTRNDCVRAEAYTWRI